MLAFSLIWLLLAAIVTLLAMRRRARTVEQDQTRTGAAAFENAIPLLAAIYSLALLAGFLYLSKFLVSGL